MTERFVFIHSFQVSVTDAAMSTSQTCCVITLAPLRVAPLSLLPKTKFEKWRRWNDLCHCQMPPTRHFTGRDAMFVPVVSSSRSWQTLKKKTTFLNIKVEQRTVSWSHHQSSDRMNDKRHLPCHSFPFKGLSMNHKPQLYLWFISDCVHLRTPTTWLSRNDPNSGRGRLNAATVCCQLGIQ